ncbi:MAG: hypothetical protein ACI94Y_003220 [Maribacter sp.]
MLANKAKNVVIALATAIFFNEVSRQKDKLECSVYLVSIPKEKIGLLFSYDDIRIPKKNQLKIENMKILLISIVAVFLPILLFGQMVEIEGKVKVTIMEEDITVDSIVVMRSGGELSRRHVLSFPDKTGGWTEEVDTIWTMKRVGIGTSTPVSILDLDGAYSDPLIPGISSNGILRIGVTSIEALDIGKKGSGTYDAWLQSGFDGSADPISLQPLGGNVGIGILSPSEKLHVNGNLRVAGIISGVSDPISAQDAATKAYVDGIDTDDQSIDQLSLSGTTLEISLSDDGVAPQTVDLSSLAVSAVSYTIGLWPELGGYVFWVSSDGKHGLVAETQDQGLFGWYEAQNEISNPINHSLDSSKFRDWRMPTKYELNEMYLQRNAIGGFAVDWYWSSTELVSSNAWLQFFNGGNQDYDDKYSNGYVRAVRAF